MPDRIIHVIVDIICLVNHDQVFLEASDALTTIKIYALICTSEFFRSMRTVLFLVQICIVRCALEEISKICDVCDRYKFVKTSDLFILSLFFFVFIYFVFFLFSLINCIVRLSIFVNIVAWFKRLYIAYWQEESRE